MTFIATVELGNENQVKKTKHGSNICNKNYMDFGINRKGALHYKSEQSKRIESKLLETKENEEIIKK